MARTWPSPLQEELELLEAESFEIQDYSEGPQEDLMASSCCSTTSSCTSSSGTSCCG
ncbi:thiazolylpeptide-type bacteriocin [Microbispora sp. NPDC088329]|uniref:thiazolylpeptide-type bacteriocin n=1 Tax=unclassified Microbispora TaxID=2614687 RepID=UPI0034200705